MRINNINKKKQERRKKEGKNIVINTEDLKIPGMQYIRNGYESCSYLKKKIYRLRTEE